MQSNMETYQGLVQLHRVQRFLINAFYRVGSGLRARGARARNEIPFAWETAEISNSRRNNMSQGELRSVLLLNYEPAFPLCHAQYRSGTYLNNTARKNNSRYYLAFYARSWTERISNLRGTLCKAQLPFQAVGLQLYRVDKSVAIHRVK